jgi:hypothetical protein
MSATSPLLKFLRIFIRIGYDKNEKFTFAFFSFENGSKLSFSKK